jgi:carbonic anhydrase
MATTVKTLIQPEPARQSTTRLPEQEKPENGLKGLKYWKEDLLAGLVVSFVATPISVGIAIASGAPPVAGLISAVVAGFVLPLFGGSYVTISGPAAGLAPAIYAAILTLGHNDMETGFKMLLPVIFMVGLVQIVLSQLKVARFSKIFPMSVIEGMMASIGLMIVFKQIPLIIGHKFQAHEFWGIVAETPSELLRHANPKVTLIGTLSLGLIVGLYALKNKIKLLQTFPPQLITVIVGTILGSALMLDKKFLISLPDNPLANAMNLGNFQLLFSHSSVLAMIPLIIVTLTLIDGIESLATISAVDKIDPYRRKSDPDRTLLAMGASNIVSSLGGGLTLIPEILRSSTNILVGGKTQWANFFCAFFVLTYLLLFKGVISMIPLTVLSAVVLYTGYTLCSPGLWKKVYRSGLDQFVIFLTTIYITVTYDLMRGIFAGVLLAAFINILSIVYHQKKAEAFGKSLPQIALDTFKNPVERVTTNQGTCDIYVNKPVVCTNFIALVSQLKAVPKNVQRVYVHFSRDVQVIDHTAAEHLLHYVEEAAENGQVVTLLGMDKLKNAPHFEAEFGTDYVSG